MNKPNVGVIGLGSMGGGVAQSLLRAGFAVHVCDVRPEVVQAFVDGGAIACASPAELGAACDVVIVLVVNAEQTDDGAVRRARRGVGHAQGQRARHERHRGAGLCRARWAPRLAERGILMIDAPVSGGAAKAATGEMTMMASGAPEAFACASRCSTPSRRRSTGWATRPAPAPR